jgi:RNA polymerase sigma-70 factor (ECF subfamily)
MTTDERDQKLIEMMTQHQRAVYGFIYSLLGNAADADDVLQNTYFTMWKKRESFHGEGNFVTWACSFAKLQAFSHRRKSRRGGQNLVDDEMLDLIACETERQLSDREERLTAMRECLENLPERQRELLNLRYYEAKSAAAMASFRDTSESVIHVTMHRIRKALLRCIRVRLDAEVAR